MLPRRRLLLDDGASEAPPGATLYQHWSAEAIENALASFAPRKAVPAFKLKQNGGKSELVRDAAIGPKYYGGWTAFVKAAVSFQGDFTFLTSPAEAPVHLYHISGDAGVSLGRVEEGARVEPGPWKAVAAVPASAEKASPA